MAKKKYEKINGLNNEITSDSQEEKENIVWQQVKVSKETKKQLKKYSVINDMALQEFTDKIAKHYLEEHYGVEFE